MQWAGKYAICNHLAKLAPTSPGHYQTNLPHHPTNHKKRPCKLCRAFFEAYQQRRCRLLLAFVIVVPGRVFFLVFVAANKATTHHAGGGTHYGTLTAAQQATSYRTSATTDGGTFSFIAPTFFGRLGLGTAQQHNERKQNQKISFEGLHDEII